MKRWIYIMLAVVVVLGGGFLAQRLIRQARLNAEQEQLQTAQVVRGSLTSEVGATGRVRANQSAVLVFETSGIVDRVNADAGEIVEPDTVLATLEQTSLPTQIIMAQIDLVNAQKALDDLLYSELARAQSQLALSQARDALDEAERHWRSEQPGYRATADTLRAAEARLVLAQDALDNAQQAYDAVSGLPESDPVRAQALTNLISARRARNNARYLINWYNSGPGEIEQALLDAEVEVARATLADAERAWERVQDGPHPDDIAAAEARVAAAQATLGMASIRAPFRGTITSVNVSPGDVASPGLEAFRIADLSRLLVDVEVSEVDIAKVETGQDAILVFDAVPASEYPGQVIEVALTGTSAQGVVTFNVTVRLSELDGVIRPGMTAAVNIVVDQIEDVLMVPNRAVRILDGQRVVYVLRDGVIEPVAVELGASSETHSEIVEGALEEGDTIVLNLPTSLMDAEHPPFMGPGR